MYTHGHHGERSLQVSRKHPASEEQVRVLVLPPGVSDQELSLREKSLVLLESWWKKLCPTELLFILCVCVYIYRKEDSASWKKNVLYYLLRQEWPYRWCAVMEVITKRVWSLYRKCMVCDQQCQRFGKKTKLVYPECKTVLYGMLHRIFNELGRKLLVFIIPHINQMLVS